MIQRFECGIALVIAEIMGWKRLAKWIGKFVKDEPDLSPEQHVL